MALLTPRRFEACRDAKTDQERTSQQGQSVALSRLSKSGRVALNRSIKDNHAILDRRSDRSWV